MKIKKNHIIITALAVLIATAGYINYTGDFDDIISIRNKNNDKALEVDSNVNNLNNTNSTNSTDISNNEIVSNDFEPDPDSMSEPGEVILTSTGVSKDIIANAKLNREQVRAANTEGLLDIVNNKELSEEAKQSAVKQLAEITNNSEKEAAIEILLEAKGFSDVVVSIDSEGASVVVNEPSLSDIKKTQIEDIVKRKTGFNASKISINVCNN